MTKKQTERQLATLIQQDYLPTFTLDPTDHERPDFCLADGKKTIGLELTYLISQEQTRTDGVANKLQQRLHELRLERIRTNPGTVLGTVHLFAIPHEDGKTEGYWPPRREHDAFSNELLDLVERTATGQHQTISIDPATTPRIAILQGLQVRPAPTTSQLLPWDLWPNARSAGTSQALMETCIRKKKALAATYDRTGLDELLLGIITGPWEIELAGSFQDNLNAATGGDPAPYNRIIIADPNNPHQLIVGSISKS
jgi:hypothetical protein